jgi:GTP-binding protein
VVEAGSTRYTIADVPGLIEGASEGKGLGLQFLRHVERCSALLHVIDCATLEPGRDPISDLDKLLAELDNYEVDEGTVALTERPQLIALNKIDVPDARELAEFVKESFEQRGYTVYLISTITKEGLKELNFALAELVGADRASKQVAVRPRIQLMQQKRDETSFDVKLESKNAEPLFRIIGAKPERWVAQTDFGNEEAIGYLAERLAKIGIEEALLKAGAKRGSTVVIGSEDGIVFDWEPMVSSVAEVTGPRGSDSRLDPNNRRTNQQRRMEYHETMDIRTRMRQRMEATRESSLVAEEFLADTEENQEK